MVQDSQELRVVGAKLRELRQAKGMNLREAAERTNNNRASHSHLSQIENGRIDPSLSTLLRYLQVLGVRLAYVEDGRVRALGQDVWAVGATLKKLRQARELTIRELAARINHSGHGHVSRIESGQGDPHLSTLLRCLRALGARLAYME